MIIMWLPCTPYFCFHVLQISYYVTQYFFTEAKFKSLEKRWHTGSDRLHTHKAPFVDTFTFSVVFLRKFKKLVNNTVTVVLLQIKFCTKCLQSNTIQKTRTVDSNFCHHQFSHLVYYCLWNMDYLVLLLAGFKVYWSASAGSLACFSSSYYI